MTQTYTIPAHADDAEFLEEWGVVRAVYIDLRARGFQVVLNKEPPSKILNYKRIDWPTPQPPVSDQKPEVQSQLPADFLPDARQFLEAGRA